jgi:lysophospholipase L1-like esterase
MDIKKIDKNMEIKKADENGLLWYAPSEKPFKLMGFNWFDREKLYRRLPLNPKHKLPPAVDTLSWCTAGGQIKFRSNSKKICLKVVLRDSSSMDHMAQTGMSGFDLYVGEPQKETFYSVTRFPCGETKFTYEMFNCEIRKLRNFTFNFPLYKGVNEIMIGLEDGAELRSPPQYQIDRPIVIYGTSITQGGCASRPGSCYSNILSRRLNVPFINLGFSGSGRGEAELAHNMATIKDPAIFVLDYEANCVDAETLAKTMPQFISILRAKHRNIPILVISGIPYGKEAFSEKDANDNSKSKKKVRLQYKIIQKKIVRGLRLSGDKNIYFLDGSKLLGKNYWESTVDGVHPTDMGFFRMADGIEPAIKKILF